MRRLLALALFVGVLIAGWRFAAENDAPVRVHYLAGELQDVVLWKVILVAFGAGAVLVALGWLLYAARSGLVQHRYRKALGGLEAEIHQLRNLPLAPDPPAPGDSTAVADVPPPGEALGRGA